MDGQEGRPVASLLLRFEEIRRNHPGASGQGQPKGIKRLSMGKVSEWFDNHVDHNACSAYRYHADSLKRWASGADGESPGIAAAVTMWVNAHDDLTSAAMRVIARAAHKRVLAGAEAAQVARQRSEILSSEGEEGLSTPQKQRRGSRGPARGSAQSPQRQEIKINGKTQEHLVPAKWRLISERELTRLLSVEAASTERAAVCGHLRSLLERAGKSGDRSAFPPEAVSLWQRVLGIAPNVGHDAIAAAGALGAAALLHRLGLGAAEQNAQPALGGRGGVLCVGRRAPYCADGGALLVPAAVR